MFITDGMAKGHYPRYRDHMKDDHASVTGRHSRRKAATRAAIVGAARELLAEDGTDVSVQAITERADVALGSFYNHFGGKQAVFAAAATDALEEFENWLVARTAHLGDLVSVFSVRMRLFGRMSDSHPQVAAVLTRLPPSPELAPHGYSARARADVDAAVAAGEIAVDDIDIRMIAAQGSFRSLVALRQRDPSVGAERADDLAAVILELFDVPRATAQELAHRPLDELLG
jgi:AcrR family transcriptional regulator